MTPKYLSPRKGRQHPLLPSHLITQQKQSFRKDTGHAQGQGHPARLSVPIDILLGPLGLLMSPNSSATALTATKIFLADSLAPPEPGEAAEKKGFGPKSPSEPQAACLGARAPISNPLNFKMGCQQVSSPAPQNAQMPCSRLPIPKLSLSIPVSPSPSPSSFQLFLSLLNNTRNLTSSRTGAQPAST